jgi:uncharacterized protein with FMN-binding domain
MMIRSIASLMCALGTTSIAMADQGRYLDTTEFLASVFPTTEPQQQVLWVTPQVRESVEGILGHRFSLLRVRYWQDGDRTAWIIDEIGKEEPITIGVSIDGNRVGAVRVLEFRESRGWEIRYPFFTDQFDGARRIDGSGIDKRIDGISGATLSVSAVSRVVEMALLLHEQIPLANRGSSQHAAAGATY